jgi:acyl carrier protein
MSNREKYVHAFVEALEIKEEQAEGLKYQEIEAWDSVGHMSLIAEIEDAFNIMMDTDDIIDFEKGIEILKKYEIEI